MGRIERVVLHNFKSYAGTHTLGPMTDFTAIIGPNGAGKSNILDAISFVMGVRSSQLRGQALSDLIYKPTTIEQELEAEERKDKGEEEEEEVKEEKTGPATAPARDAYVELIYALSEDELHLFSPPPPSSQLRFRRTINRGGASQYRLNERLLRWEEYSEQLERLGVSIKSKNFLVFQGDVESIAQRNPRQMSDMVEAISGSAALRDEYERKKEEWEKGEEDFLRVVDRHNTVKRERAQLKRQKEEAEEYQQLIADVAEKKTELYLWSLYHLCEDLKQKQDEVEQSQQRLDEKVELRAEVEQRVKEALADVARRKRQLSEAEKALTDRSRRLEKKRPEHIRLREEIKHLQGQLTRQERELEQFLKKREQQRREVRKLEDDLGRLREEIQAMNDAEAKEEEKSREIQLAEADRREYAELRKRLNAAISELNERKRTLQAVVSRQRDAVERHLEMIRELTERRTKEEDIRREMARRGEQLAEQVEEVRRSLEANRKKRAEGEKRANQREAQKAKMNEELSAVVARLEDASSRSRDSSRQQRAAGMVEQLQRHFPNIHGRLIDLVKPTARKYELPTTIALGRHLDSVVVDSEQVALQCVEYMREQKMGVATFLPLDTVRVKPVSEALRNLGGTARLLIDVLQYDDTITRALLYAAGNTVVADRLDEAQRLKFGADATPATQRMKIVTVDGSIIHKGGNMTGGVGRHQQDAGRFEQKAVDADRTRKDELVGRLRELDSHRADDEQRALDAAIGRDEISLRYLEADLKANAGQLARKEGEMKEVEAKLRELQPDVEAKEAEVDAKEGELKEVDAEVAQEEQRVFAAFNRRIGVRSIREYEEGRLKAVQEHSRRKVELSKQEAALTSALEYERAREENDKTERKLRGKMEGNRKKLAEAVEKEAAKTEEIDADKEGVNEAADAVKEAQLSVEEKEREMKEAQKELAAVVEEINTLQKTLAAVNGAIEVIREEMRELMKTARVEQVALPRKKKRGRAVEKKGAKRSGKKARDEDDEVEDADEDGEEEEDADAEMITEEEQALMMEDGDPCSTLDFSRVEHRDVRSLSERERQRAVYLQAISDLHAAAERLAPNLKAIDKFRDVSERFDAVQAELEAQRAEVRTVESAWAAVKEQRARLFSDCFNALKLSIQHIYQSLTASVDLPMGGKAMLLLEGEDDEPYLHGAIYRVMPPMKRYMPMEALSGGEKTVASLALIFALHAYKPSPFFVLDEIDAALDNLNVQRVANYVRSRAMRDHLQVLVISLKETFYSKAQSLIGVYRDVESKSSANLHLDLAKYD